ncbi:MAG: 3-dehydroquinate synthase [Candidatus Omnitrophica bacterium]|nr:3-dehydroquinate synthase [Candidatus Omnitrophota bacterium]
MKKITVHLGERFYPIMIGRGLLAKAGNSLKALGIGQKVMIVSNRRVAREGKLLPSLVRSLKRSGFTCHIHLLSFGDERDKSEKELFRLWNALLEARLDRTSTLVALGGGVVGDLCGFAASTYARGISLVHVPTTLLAQVDSAIGGKTAIDLPKGKNMVGTFYQPKLILSDLDSLATLDVQTFQNSFAEVVKYGVIRDPKLFKLLERRGTVFLKRAKKHALGSSDFRFLEEMIYRSSKIKALVVERDERETKGLRTILNYGHTFAHVLETASRYRMPHGEAVGLGMILAAKFACKLGRTTTDFVDRQLALIRALCPASSLRKVAQKYYFTWKKLKPLFQHDKKVVAGDIRFVLPIRLGKVQVVFAQKNDWQIIRSIFQEMGVD